jgi:hypothetical protein
LHEANRAGMDNAWWAVKRKKGYYLYGNEVGQVGGACRTLCDALNSEWNQFSGDTVQIETNVSLEELFEILGTSAFEPLLTLKI